MSSPSLVILALSVESDANENREKNGGKKRFSTKGFYVAIFSLQSIHSLAWWTT